MRCPFKNHQKEEISYICMAQSCQLPEKICNICLNQSHLEHKDQCISIKNFNEFIFSQFFSQNQTKILDSLKEIQEYLTSDIQKITKSISAMFLSLPFKGKAIILNLINKIQESQPQLQNILQQVKEYYYQETQKTWNFINLCQDQLQPNLQQQIQQGVNCQDDDQDKVLLQQQQEQKYQIQKKLNLKQQIENFNASLAEYQLQNQIFTQPENIKILNDKPNSIIRISKMVQGPLQFFPNPKEKNVFANDGTIVYYSDISEGQEFQRIFKQTITLLANFCPEKLQELFITQSINKYSYYAVQVFDSKKLKSQLIEVDDYIEKNKPFLIGSNNSIWITLLWKAISSYIYQDQDLINIINYLMPSPSFVIETTEENLLQKLQSELSQNSFMFTIPCSCRHSEITQEMIQVLGFQLVQNPFFGDDTMLIKMRSPTSKHIYNGDWGFQSPYWTNELIEKLKIPEIDDGVFYIDFASFMKEFHCLNSHRIYESLIWTEKCFFKAKQGSYFQLEVESESEYIFQLLFKNNNQNLCHNQQFIIGQLQKDNDSGNETYLYITSFLLHHPQCFKVILKPGTYILYFKMQFDLSVKGPTQGYIKIYSSNNIKFAQIPKIVKFKELVYKDFIYHTKKNVLNTNQCKINYQQDDSSLIISVNNISQLVFHIRVQFVVFENLKLCKPFSGQVVEQKVQKGDILIVRAKKLSPHAVQFKATFYINGKQVA